MRHTLHDSSANSLRVMHASMECNSTYAVRIHIHRAYLPVIARAASLHSVGLHCTALFVNAFQSVLRDDGIGVLLGDEGVGCVVYVHELLPGTGHPYTSIHLCVHACV